MNSSRLLCYNTKRYRNERLGVAGFPCYHVLMTGNYASGKQTIARILKDLFFAEKVISENFFYVELAKNIYPGYDLERKLEGAKSGVIFIELDSTKSKIKEASGGVLFIDEAYSLYAPDSPKDYGLEAISTLIKEMEDSRNDLAVIFAGYSKEMEQFISSNPGLKSRIGYHIDFPDYSAEELTQIFNKFCADQDYILDTSIQDKLEELFTEVYRNRDKNFSNGRFARNVFERMKLIQAERLVESKLFEIIAYGELFCMTLKEFIRTEVKDIMFIGEYEMPSRFSKIKYPAESSYAGYSNSKFAREKVTQYIHHTLLIEDIRKERENTDPYVFGDKF